MIKRSAGILMPIFSLPTKYGIGTFGKSAYQFVDYLCNMNILYWQILPLHPTTLGNSPYQSTSTFAGNINFIDLEMLCDKGYIKKNDFEKIDFGKDKNKVDYDKVNFYKKEILIKAGNNFLSTNNKEYKNYIDFKKEYDFFLNDYAIYSVIKDRYNGKELFNWDKIHRMYHSEVIKEFTAQNEYDIEIYKVIQFFFFSQWYALKKYANDKGIKIIGDMPIYSSLDSSEVFANYKNFLLDENRNPISVAGCPPDAFSMDGQLWNNPLYDYDYMEKDNYNYFISRVSHLNKLYDVIRIDHFRGFSSYYSIKYGMENAKNGIWIKGPSMKIFDAINEKVKNLCVIAEDLGYIDNDVINLLNETGYPGMKVLQFAFSGDIENNPYLPKNYNENCVAYLGTHDNDTFMGWYDKLNDSEKNNVKKYLNIKNEKEANLDAIKELFLSNANLVIITMQDLLGLNSESRINVPSTINNDNWSYRFDEKYLTDNIIKFVKDLTKQSKRCQNQ